MKTNPWRVLAAACLLSVGAGIFVVAASGNSAAQRDFISYWAAGHQLVRGANPYDETAILRIERAEGLGGDRPLVMRNPPVAFFLAIPLGLIGAKTGIMIWSLLILACLVSSIRILWTLHGRPDDRLHLLGYCFAPALACLIAGQVGIFLLLGMALFLRLIESSPFLAGASLLLCAIKPHLFVPFGLGLLAWALTGKASRGRLKVLAGGAAAVLGSCALSFAFDQLAWQQYAQMMHASSIADEFIPTLSVILRMALDRHRAWLQFIPMAFACLWALWYYRKHRARWKWSGHGMVLLLVSIACAPYAWFSDEAVLFPAALTAIYCARGQNRSLIPFGVVAGIALIEVLSGVQMTSGFYIWTTPAWLAWYLFATRAASTRQNTASAL